MDALCAPPNKRKEAIAPRASKLALQSSTSSAAPLGAHCKENRIDPPFATGADFSINIKLGDLKWTKEASVIEEKAYRDTWGRGLDSYLQMMYDRLVLMRELLADNGSIYVHLDWHVGHYVKII